MDTNKDQDQNQKYTVRSLVSKVDDGLDNPMLVAIAEVAPSPAAADKYITKTLGWPNPVGQMVRDMVRLHQKVDETHWKTLIESSVRPADILFVFGEEFEGLHGSFTVETGMRWFRTGVLRSGWPFLLREFRMNNLENTSSFDGKGDLCQKEVSDPELIHTPPDGFLTINQRTLRGFLEFSIGDGPNDNTARIRIMPSETSDVKDFSIMGWSATLLPKPEERIFPAFYKVVKITKTHADKSTEEISVAIRRDFCGLCFQTRQGVGNVIYRKTSGNLGSGWKANLVVNYDIISCNESSVFNENTFVLDFISGKEPIICFSLPEDTIAPALAPESISLSQSEAVRVAGDMTGTLNKIMIPCSLNKVLGKGLIEKPPKTLAELLSVGP